METVDRTREQLANYILTSAKQSSLFKIVALLNEEGETFDKNLTEEQIDELEIRRNNYLSGKSRTYTFQEIKQELIDKHGLQA
jgi:hypothetical protein